MFIQPLGMIRAFLSVPLHMYCGALQGERIFIIDFYFWFVFVGIFLHSYREDISISRCISSSSSMSGICSIIFYFQEMDGLLPPFHPHSWSQNPFRITAWVVMLCMIRRVWFWVILRNWSQYIYQVWEDDTNNISTLHFSLIVGFILSLSIFFYGWWFIDIKYVWELPHHDRIVPHKKDVCEIFSGLWIGECEDDGGAECGETQYEININSFLFCDRLLLLIPQCVVVNIMVKEERCQLSSLSVTLPIPPTTTRWRVKM